MALLVVRLLGVYALSAAALILLSHQFVRRLHRGPALLLALGPLLLTGQAVFSGGVYAPLDITYTSGEPLVSYQREAGIEGTRTPLLSDVVNSYIPSRKAVREALRTGHLPLWNRFSMAGEPLLAFQQPAALHPATWIGLALPLAHAWTFEMAFRLLLAMLSAYLFFRDLDCGEIASLFGAAAWALSDHLVFWLGYSVGASVAPFPLLLLGLRQLARGGGRRALAITVVSLVLVTLGGHPETLLHAVAGGGVYFLFELAAAPRGRRGRAVARALLAGALALGLTAVVLLPFAEILPETATHQMRSGWYASARRSVDLLTSWRRSARDVLPFAFGLSGHGRLAGGFDVPAAYAGSLVFPLAAVGLLSRRRERWALAALAVLGLAFWARLVGITDVVSKLPLFKIAVNDYLVFLAVFGLVALATLGLDRLAAAESPVAFLAAALVTAAGLVALFVSIRPELLGLEMNPEYLARRLLLQCIPLAVAAAVVWLLRRRGVAAATVLGLVFLVARTMEASEVYPTCSFGSFYPIPEVLKNLPRPSRDRIVALGYTWIPNMPALYELEDVRGYEALTLGRLVETYPLWCVAQPIWFNRVDDASKPFLSFLGVRYAFAASGQEGPSGWRMLSEARGGRVFESPSVLPRVFVPSSIGYLNGTAQQLDILARITDFGAYGVVERPADRPTDSGAWEPNGRAVLRLLADEGQDLTLEIDAAERTLVATSLPFWPGWKVTVDGRPVAAGFYNRAFFSFHVPPGRHAVRLRYWPDGFVYGLAISGGTLLVCLVLMCFPKARVASAPRTGECHGGSG